MKTTAGNGVSQPLGTRHDKTNLQLPRSDMPPSPTSLCLACRPVSSNPTARDFWLDVTVDKAADRWSKCLFLVRA